jgi:hypothetical protein
MDAIERLVDGTGEVLNEMTDRRPVVFRAASP